MSLSDAVKAAVRLHVAAYAADELDRRDRAAYELCQEALLRLDEDAAELWLYERLMIKRRLSGVPLETP